MSDGASADGDAGGGVPTWLQSLGDADLAAHPALAKFPEVKDLARAYPLLEKKIGEKGIIPPGPNAPESEHRAFKASLGCPDAPGGYADPEGFAWPGGIDRDNEFEGDLRQMAHEIGIPQSQWAEMLPRFVEAQAKQLGRFAQKQQAHREETMTELQREWGSAFEAEKQTATQLFQHVFGEKFAEVGGMVLADGTQFGNHPSVVRAFAQLAKDSGFVEGTGFDRMGVNRVTLTPEEATRELNELLANEENMAAWGDSTNAKHGWVVKRRSELMQMASGERPARSDVSHPMGEALEISGGGMVAGDE